MTAEIAILNKSAVALAADSAVTISAGSHQEKIFDTADKLFELSNYNPIGIMIYNGMSFLETPLPVLIRDFRNQCRPVDKVTDAADDFLKFLNEFAIDARAEVKRHEIYKLIAPIIEKIETRAWENFRKKFVSRRRQDADSEISFSEILSETIDVFKDVYARQKDASFVGEGTFKVDANGRTVIREIVAEDGKYADDNQQDKITEVCILVLEKELLSEAFTGLVISGFGSKELFPTMVSFEIDGMICDRLKYLKREAVDIDRRGTGASVIPFAQKEMVERFLYGLDEDIQRQVTTFCKTTVSSIKSEIIDKLDIENEEHKRNLLENAGQAEDAFVKGLSSGAFGRIRKESRLEIEQMVEFMPKPELAKMAEALVNLTSIKRRVSRGVETVGGPIDVAVISKAEGFVWVKRKHYFPSELNARYVQRLRQGHNQRMEVPDGDQAKSRSAGAARGRKKKG